MVGEKVEIIPYVEDPAAFVVNALAFRVAKVVVDELLAGWKLWCPTINLALPLVVAVKIRLHLNYRAGILMFQQKQNLNGVKKSSRHGQPLVKP